MSWLLLRGFQLLYGAVFLQCVWQAFDGNDVLLWLKSHLQQCRCSVCQGKIQSQVLIKYVHSMG